MLTIEYSPIIAMNRTYALARANSIVESIQEAHKLELKNNHHYFCLLAELYHIDNNIKKEIEYLSIAIRFAIKKNEKDLIKDRLDKASRLNT